MTPYEGLDVAISRALGRRFVAVSCSPVRGGDIHQSVRLVGECGQRFFAKLNAPDRAWMFAAEADGLAALSESRTIRVPRVVAQGGENELAYLVLEWLDLGGNGDAAELGRNLACMHQVFGRAHGWRQDNCIGSSLQKNPETADWPAFFRDARLGYQLHLAQAHGAGRDLLEKGARLLSVLDGFFPGYLPSPSLLHGDLWGGNHGFAGGVPVLFDPAVYFGDRETDLAMTELFGGFPAAFHAAYREAFPLDPGYSRRKTLYNLYHVLNHFNLFGGGYERQALDMMDRLLAEVSG